MNYEPDIQELKTLLAESGKGELTDQGRQRLIELIGLEKYNVPII